MALKKQHLKSRPVCKVKFSLTAEEAAGADAAYVVGEFNNWDPSSNPMIKGKNGAFSLELELPQDSAYRFRYYLDPVGWKNDAEADGYEFCPYADENNSIVRV